MTRAGGTGAAAGDADGGARLCFKSHLRATLVPGEAAYLVSQHGVTALHGAQAEVLVPLLDGSRSPELVLRDAARRLPVEDAHASLRALDTAGLLKLRPAAESESPPGSAAAPRPDSETDPDPHPDSGPAAEAYWDLAGLDGHGAGQTVGASTVRIVLLAGADRAPAAAACRAAGVGIAEPGERADFSLVLCEDYLDPELARVDAEHRRTGTPWLPVLAGAATGWLGPVFTPGTSGTGAGTARDPDPDPGPCWHCLATRLRGHRSAERPLQRALGLDGPPPRPQAALAPGRAALLHLAALEAVKWLAGVRTEAQRCLTALDTLRLDTAAHRVDRLPQCAVCGDPGLVAARVRAPFVPRSRPKATTAEGGHRAASAAQTLERYGHLVDPVTGVIKEIRRAPGAPDFVSTFVSGRNLALGGRTLDGLRAGLRALSGGKGLTATEARTSALCEAAERYSGTRQGDEPVVRDTFTALGADAVHPNACQLYDERQFATRESWNATHSPMQHVPAPFDERGPTDWTPVWSLTSRTHRLLPTSLLYYADEASGDGLWADSNGCAAGASPEDALVQGFLELVERDAVALWWYNRTRHPALDLDAFAAPDGSGRGDGGQDPADVARLLDGYRALGREVWALDLTSDLGIPVVAALSRRTDQGGRGDPGDQGAEDILFGFGAHFDRRLALRRALTEMGQLLAAVPAAPDAGGERRDGTCGVTDPDALRWWRTATAANQPYLRPDPAMPARGPGDRPYVPRADLREDVAAITELVGSRGMELLVLDQTRPDLDLPVVKVIVPGLRHFWARFAPGRLFRTPVEQGLRASQTPYAELNPVPLFV